MTEIVFYRALLFGWAILSLAVFGYLLLAPAPYGRHGRAGWGPALRARTGWIVMEFPAVAAFAFFYLLGSSRWEKTPFFLFLLWQGHYLYRTFVFPFRLSPVAKKVPLAIVASGFFFNFVNAYINGRFLSHSATHLNTPWLADPRFLAGVLVFIGGFVIHTRADAILLGLRRDGGGYRVPEGFLYRWISCPNYLGELLQWGGWALATWSAPGLLFFGWTAANLAPRALHHHRWYRQTFPAYPPRRRALIPYLL